MADRTHLTFAISTSVLTVLLIAAGMAAGKAAAQEAPQVQPMNASMTMGERWETADCRTAAGVEVAPVSFDGLDAPKAWVVVEREGGEPVSAQRIDPDDTTLINSIQCGGNDWLKPNGAPAGS